MSDEALRKCAAWAVAIVAAIAATVSYDHIYLLSVHLGQPFLAAVLMPLSVDGTVGAASAALLSAARSKHSAPMAWVMLGLGVLATLAANGYSGLDYGPAGMILACWPAVAFIGTTEVALSMVRHAAKRPVVPDTVSDERPKVSNANRLERVKQLLDEHGPLSGAKLAEHLGDVSERTARRDLKRIANSYQEAA